MNLFCSDLDNTLIYSYKQEIGSDKRAVEIKDGKELSYMTQKSYRLLEKVKEHFCFVPITTRSLEQYRRIRLGSHWYPEYALAANGGILLDNNTVDLDWYQESKDLIKKAEKELKQSIAILEKDENVILEVRKVDDLFAFTKSNNPEKTIEILKKNIHMEEVNVYKNGQKVYVFPKILNKGNALRRLKDKCEPEFIIAAGDSDFDISMLQIAHKSFMPLSLNEIIGDIIGEKIVFNDKVFSDNMLEHIMSNSSAMQK